ncbi:hypothetical protein AYJ57_18415 [Salipiger sp. CCB-MM3]|uniref:hypothetical protein n=1 Tax=Salipiger sp. CCB-MM3 TaxID=1792508 RepID=UPI00080AA9D7|nr:hypothetical protein [Salipiger sp. CCB-MM3]ANT62386.1 hypothetical protein AYJ57_18415 [Salipiger sp. CCB-MM3]
MPDLDSGHLFLTYLIPIKRGGPRNDVSFKQKVRIELARLPPAHQTPATQKTAYAAPFARNLRNHFARMFVLDNVVYNGRNRQNALVATVKKVNTITPEPVDGLRSAYLVFTADIDAIVKDGDPLPSELSADAQRRVRMAYAQTLWETMGEEIKAIFGNCHGFDGTDSGQAFGAYLERCHVETTMPYHDYYLNLPAFNDLPLKGLIVAVGVPAVIGVGALLLRLFGMSFLLGMNTLVLGLLGVALTCLAFVLAVRFAIANGAKPLPPAAHDDLPTVLKALYIQQRFTDFIAEHQGAAPATLHAAFGDFLAQHAPADITHPTQRPGVISDRAPQPRAGV